MNARETNPGSINTLRVDTGIGFPHLHESAELREILDAALARRAPRGRAAGRTGTSSPSEPRDAGVRAPGASAPYFTASHFGLDRVARFSNAPAETRDRILHACSLRLLHEGYCIEQVGLAFTAKMVLLSQTLEERMLYALFAADEATHLHLITAHIGVPPEPERKDPFLSLLCEAVETGTKPALTYLIQVVLEGWGIGHYRALADGCVDPSLARDLASIVRDEALHHASGVCLFRIRPESREDRAFLREALVRLFEMVQAGPQAVVASLERALGHLSRSEKEGVFADLRCEEQSSKRLDLLRSLMGGERSDPYLRYLDERGAFRPYTPSECARTCATS